MKFKFGDKVRVKPEVKGGFFETAIGFILDSGETTSPSGRSKSTYKVKLNHDHLALFKEEELLPFEGKNES